MPAIIAVPPSRDLNSQERSGEPYIYRCRLFRMEATSDPVGQYIAVWDRVYEPYEQWDELPNGELVAEAQNLEYSTVHRRMLGHWALLGISRAKSRVRPVMI